MHQVSTESGLLDLSPPDENITATTIDQVLESARLRAATRDVESHRERLLPDLAPQEHWPIRLMWFVLAIALVWGHFYVVRSFWAPSHPGVDQNGYQVGGKIFSQTFSTGYKPPNPFTYVGWMWVQTPEGWVYPKYPLGVPVLDALCIWLAPDMHAGVVRSYLVSPVSTALASAAMFLMLRMFASSFAAVMGLLLMAMNPVSLVLANNSNSHAPALAFASWGILFLLWWMRYGGWWRGFIAGILLGYAVTIRYTEGLLILPILAATFTAMRYERPREIRWWAAGAWIVLAILGAVLRTSTKIPTHGWHLWVPLAVVAALFSLVPSRAGASSSGLRYIIESLRSLLCAAMVFGFLSIDLSGLHWKSVTDQGIVASILLVSGLGLIFLIYAIRWAEPRTYLRPAVTLLGWLIPVIALVAFNKGAMGSWTGYDTTNESEGFSWNYFTDKWDFMAGQVYNTGLFFVLPLGIAGMFLLYRKSARLALVMTLWFVPGLLLYSAYYWGLNTQGVGYLRFFLTIFPPMVFCAAWLLDDFSRRGNPGSLVGPIAAGIIVAIACGMNAYSAHGALERDFTIQMNLADTCDRILQSTKDAKDTTIADSNRRPLLFGEARGFMNFMQYIGNYECYSSDAFTQRGGARMWRNVDPDAPNPLQKGRVDAMRKLYEGKSDSDLWHEGTKIIDKALADQRHVYAAMPTMTMSGFRSRFSTKDYKIEPIAHWHEPVTMSDEARKAFTALGPAALFMGGRATPQNWELIEITKNTSPTTEAPAKSGLSRLAQRLGAKSTTSPTTKPKALFEIK